MFYCFLAGRRGAVSTRRGRRGNTRCGCLHWTRRDLGGGAMPTHNTQSRSGADQGGLATSRLLAKHTACSPNPAYRANNSLAVQGAHPSSCPSKLWLGFSGSPRAAANPAQPTAGPAWPTCTCGRGFPAGPGHRLLCAPDYCIDCGQCAPARPSEVRSGRPGTPLPRL